MASNYVSVFSRLISYLQKILEFEKNRNLFRDLKTKLKLNLKAKELLEIISQLKSKIKDVIQKLITRLKSPAKYASVKLQEADSDIKSVDEILSKLFLPLRVVTKLIVKLANFFMKKLKVNLPVALTASTLIVKFVYAKVISVTYGFIIKKLVPTLEQANQAIRFIEAGQWKNLLVDAQKQKSFEAVIKFFVALFLSMGLILVGSRLIASIGLLLAQAKNKGKQYLLLSESVSLFYGIATGSGSIIFSGKDVPLKQFAVLAGFFTLIKNIFSYIYAKISIKKEKYNSFIIMNTLFTMMFSPNEAVFKGVLHSMLVKKEDESQLKKPADIIDLEQKKQEMKKEKTKKEILTESEEMAIKDYLREYVRYYRSKLFRDFTFKTFRHLSKSLKNQILEKVPEVDRPKFPKNINVDLLIKFLVKMAKIKYGLDLEHKAGRTLNNIMVDILLAIKEKQWKLYLDKISKYIKSPEDKAILMKLKKQDPPF